MHEIMYVLQRFICIKIDSRGDICIKDQSLPIIVFNSVRQYTKQIKFLYDKKFTFFLRFIKTVRPELNSI